MLSRGAKHFTREGWYIEPSTDQRVWSSSSCTLKQSVADDLQDGGHRAIKDIEKAAARNLC